jgi:hypothetical protein
MKKLWLAVLLGCMSFNAASAELDAEHSFAYVTTDSSGTLRGYIGMFGADLPVLNKNNVTIITYVFIQTSAHNGTPKGAMEQGIYAVLCDRQQYKSVRTHSKDYEDAEVQAIFSDLASTYNVLEKQPFSPIKIDSMTAAIIDVGCKYTDNLKAQRAPAQKQKANPKDDPSYRQL